MTKATKIALLALASVIGLLGVVVVAALVVVWSSPKSSNSNFESRNSNANTRAVGPTPVPTKLPANTRDGGPTPRPTSSPAKTPDDRPTPVPTAEPPQLRMDRILENMNRGNIAFNTPTKMKLDSPSTIQLVLSPSSSIDELKKLIVAEGEKEGAQIRVSDRMEAHLSGTAFQISTITPEHQAVTWNEPTEWKWEVQPTQYGRHNLHLTLTAIITAEGSSMPRTLRTFDKTIEVEVSSWRRVFQLFRENWEWMWTLLAFPIGAWLWRRRQINKSNPQTQKRTKKGRRKNLP